MKNGIISKRCRKIICFDQPTDQNLKIFSVLLNQAAVNSSIRSWNHQIILYCFLIAQMSKTHLITAVSQYKVNHPVRPTLTWSSIHGLDLFSRLQVPEPDVSIEGAGGSDRPVVTDVHRHHPQLVALQSPLQLQLLIRPAGTARRMSLNVRMCCFSLSVMIVNDGSLDFGQKKQSEDVNLGSVKLWWAFFLNI